MADFCLAEITAAVGGEVINQTGIADDAIRVGGVCSDSRFIQEGELFVALKGERFDGHDYCEAVSSKNVRVFLLSKKECLPADRVGIVVDDTLEALQRLASYYRNRLNCKVIAVTGSVGKTSTREMIAKSLASSLKIHATTRNNNNEIGLPATILSAPENTQVMVLEMGMRQRGEIRLLANIARPDIAVVTNIGVSHIERLGSKENILAAKMEICEGLGNKGVLLVNADDSLLAGYIADKNNISGNKVGAAAWTASSFRPLSADYRIYSDRILMSESGTSFDAVISEGNGAPRQIHVDLSTTGKHHVKNAMFSLMCAYILGLDLDQVKDALGEYTPMEGRGKVTRTNRYIVYDDSYNASPESMAAAFDSVSVLAGTRRKIAAIGGMLELGAFAPQLHYLVGASAAEAGIDRVYVCGPLSESIREGVKSVRPDIPVLVCKDREALTEVLLKDIRPGDVILTKASNAFEFDKVAAEIIRNDGGSIAAKEEK
ncbi:MAG: UDP-N-acetylmuramoyl-tripeptide--D-alanyl-D-alanine ligase [Clostridiales bacterium]|nr:UDP-N-acetylmuramoyl-tripeptide--D-alanyl-D-alanine ligase [Clostridiales bacterium]